MTPQFDVVIAGGGMVGASLAVAIAPLGLRVGLVEPVPHDSALQPSFDERTTALSNGSRRIFETLGIWREMAAAATPIAKIHVSDQGHFGSARIDAAEQGLRALGFVVPNRVLGAALWSQIRTGRTTQGRVTIGGATQGGATEVFCPGQITAINARKDAVALTVTAADGTVTAIETRLIVAADGAHSSVRAAFGVDGASRDYGQTAVITTVLPQHFHDHVAFERFTASGPLALLPLADGRCTLVLTLTHELAKEAMAWSDAEFLAEVQRRFGFRLGRFLKVGRRVPYALALTQAARTTSGRCAILGNAAQGLHPVAGMGFNLGLRDVASLAELIADHCAAGAADAGAPELLAEYDAWRREDRRAIIHFTDGLVRVFSNPLGVVRRVRNLPAKSALAALSTGASGRTPKLTRGVALR
jgi:2-octaprenyl-6-methoxyphenol hydroxylase